MYALFSPGPKNFTFYISKKEVERLLHSERIGSDLIIYDKDQYIIEGSVFIEIDERQSDDTRFDIDTWLSDKKVCPCYLSRYFVEKILSNDAILSISEGLCSRIGTAKEEFWIGSYSESLKKRLKFHELHEHAKATAR